MTDMNETAYVIAGKEVVALRYGENPHQPTASLFVTEDGRSDPLALANFERIEGTELGYVLATDIDRCLATMSRVACGWHARFGEVPAMAASVKHGGICGFGVGGDNPYSGCHEATVRMIEGDPQALFGGTVMVSSSLNLSLAMLLQRHSAASGTKRILDCVVASDFSPDAIDELARKSGKCRLLRNPALKTHLGTLDTASRFRQVRGGFLVQDPDVLIPSIPDEWDGRILRGQVKDLIIAEGIGRTSTSNTIVLVKDQKFIGMGVAQPSRVLAAEVAVLRAKHAGHEIEGAVAYSDSFFPFTDGLAVLAQAGVKVVLATSPPTKNEAREVDMQEVCERYGVTLILAPDQERRGFSNH